MITYRLSPSLFSFSRHIAILRPIRPTVDAQNELFDDRSRARDLDPTRTSSPAKARLAGFVASPESFEATLTTGYVLMRWKDKCSIPEHSHIFSLSSGED